LILMSVISASLSIAGSSVIVYKVIKNRQKASPYDRLLLGLSTCDIISSINAAVGPFLSPAETSPRIWAVGTDTTCTFSGFLFQFSISAMIYNAILSYYYLLTVRFNVKKDWFAKYVEPWCHCLTWLFFMVTASAGAAIGLYGEFELGFGCWVNDYPEGCDNTDPHTCTSPLIGWIIGGLPSLFTLVSILVNNLVIFFFVRRTLGKRLERTDSDSAQQEERDTAARQRVHIREVASQGLLYTGTFFLSQISSFVLRVLESMGYTYSDESSIFPLLVTHALLSPLQGFFNLFVYTRPNYLRVRKAYPNMSVLSALRKACLDTDIPRLSEVSDLTGSRRKSGEVPRVVSRSHHSMPSRSFTSSLPLVLEGSREDSSSMKRAIDLSDEEESVDAHSGNAPSFTEQLQTQEKDRSIADIATP